MARAKETQGVSKELEKHIKELLKIVDQDAENPEYLKNKLAVIDRYLKLESLKQKDADANFGAGFNDDNAADY